MFFVINLNRIVNYYRDDVELIDLRWSYSVYTGLWVQAKWHEWEWTGAVERRVTSTMSERQLAEAIMSVCFEVLEKVGNE